MALWVMGQLVSREVEFDGSVYEVETGTANKVVEDGVGGL